MNGFVRYFHVRPFLKDLSLVAYCKTIVKILGYIEVYVQCNKTRKKLNIYITELEKEPLLGREWIRQLKGVSAVCKIFSGVTY